MAKPTKFSGAGGKVKLRIIEFELDGSDEALQDGLKNLAAALMRGAGIPPSRQLKYDSKREEVQADSEPEDVEDADVLEPEGEPERAVKRAPTGPRKPPAVVILNDIKFNDVKPTLREFYDSKKPGSINDKYLVIAHWYKNHKNIAEIGPNHFHTALRFLDLPTPKDAGLPIRDLRRKNNGKFGTGKERGTTFINHVGENTVQEMNKKS